MITFKALLKNESNISTDDIPNISIAEGFNLQYGGLVCKKADHFNHKNIILVDVNSTTPYEAKEICCQSFGNDVLQLLSQ